MSIYSEMMDVDDLRVDWKGWNHHAVRHISYDINRKTFCVCCPCAIVAALRQVCGANLKELLGLNR